MAEHIRSTLGPNARILLSLRDPATRLISFHGYLLSRMELDRDLTLEQYIDLCAASRSAVDTQDPASQRFQGYHGGFYAKALSEWFEVFGSQLRVVFFEDLESDPGRFMLALADWLGIDPQPFRVASFEVQNPGRSYRYAAVHRLSNLINDRAEYTLRRHPSLKNRLRRYYLRFNGATPESRPDPATIQRLQMIFADSNDQTRMLLERQGYEHLPTWLTLTPA